jgi:hypothetical protein
MYHTVLHLMHPCVCGSNVNLMISLYPLRFPEKTDIDIIAYQVESAGTRVSCNFDLILVDNARPNH